MIKIGMQVGREGPLNRTILELKFLNGGNTFYQFQPLNRTILELKCKKGNEIAKALMLSIVPYWN